MRSSKFVATYHTNIVVHSGCCKSDNIKSGIPKNRSAYNSNKIRIPGFLRNITENTKRRNPESMHATLKPTQGISFPRSGHAPVFHLIQRYFGDSLVYCDPDNHAGKFCACGTVPCVNEYRNYAKFHDFELRTSKGIDILPDERYLIQFRNPVHSIVSDYHLHKTRNSHISHTRQHWEEFAVKQIFYWNKFVDKWAINFPNGDVENLQCIYEDLLAAPTEKSREILRFIGVGEIDEARMESILGELKVEQQGNLRGFEFYDPLFFRSLEDRTNGRLPRLGVPDYAEEI